MEIEHVPVMLEEVVEGLNLKSTGIYVDATLGLGGHTKSIIERAAGCILIGIDRDERAIELASERLKDHKNTYFVCLASLFPRLCRWPWQYRFLVF